VAENFGTSQNRELLEKLAEQTGGRYYKPDQASKLASEISYSEAGITARETRDLWDMRPFSCWRWPARFRMAAAPQVGRGMSSARCCCHCPGVARGHLLSDDLRLGGELTTTSDSRCGRSTSIRA